MKKLLTDQVPYLYFTGIVLWLFVESKSEANSYALLFFTIPFLWQLIRYHKTIDWILSGITFFWSMWMLLAYLSDAGDIMVWNAKAWNFITIGGLFVTANFVMTFWMVRNATWEGGDLQQKNSSLSQSGQ